MPSTDFTPIIVTTTSDNRSVLEKISYQLVESQLAGCVQVHGPIISCYRWNGQIESSEEWTCAIKTSQQKFEALEEVVRKLHNYEEPQLIAVPIIAGSQGYLDWIHQGLSQ